MTGGKAFLLATALALRCGTPAGAANRVAVFGPFAAPVVRAQAEGETDSMRAARAAREARERAAADPARASAEASLVTPGTEATRRATEQGPRTVQQRAEELRRQNGANSVTVQRGPGESTRYDLAGRAHYDKATGTTVPTPHVLEQRTDINVNRTTGQAYPREVAGRPRQMTQADARTVSRVLEQRAAAPRHAEAPKSIEPSRMTDASKVTDSSKGGGTPSVTRTADASKPGASAARAPAAAPKTSGGGARK